jgi:hypothetical protein
MGVSKTGQAHVGYSWSTSSFDSPKTSFRCVNTVRDPKSSFAAKYVGPEQKKNKYPYNFAR